MRMVRPWTTPASERTVVPRPLARQPTTTRPRRTCAVSAEMRRGATVGWDAAVGGSSPSEGDANDDGSSGVAGDAVTGAESSPPGAEGGVVPAGAAAHVSPVPVVKLRSGPVTIPAGPSTTRR